MPTKLSFATLDMYAQDLKQQQSIPVSFIFAKNLINKKKTFSKYFIFNATLSLARLCTDNQEMVLLTTANAKRFCDVDTNSSCELNYLFSKIIAGEEKNIFFLIFGIALAQSPWAGCFGKRFWARGEAKFPPPNSSLE